MSCLNCGCYGCGCKECYRNSCCGGPYYPMPICFNPDRYRCPCGSVEIINPDQNMPSAATLINNGECIDENHIIPLCFYTKIGEGINVNGFGALELCKGSYHITYNTKVTVPAEEMAAVGIKADGFIISPSISSATALCQAIIFMTKTVVIDVDDGTIVELFNSGANSTMFSDTVFSIVKTS